MLLEAILQSKYGHGPILVVESNKQLGGNWTSQVRFGHQIDNGPHLLYNFNTNMSAFFSLLTRITGCFFEEMRPPPRSDSLLNQSLVEFSFGLYGSWVLKSLRAARALFARPWLPVLKPLKYFRPEGGLSAVVRHYEKKLVSLGVEIRLESTVNQLHECSNGLVQITFDSGEMIYAQKVKASAASLPSLFKVSDGTALPKFRVRTYAQAYIYLRNVRKNVFLLSLFS